jgi:hypothetical protein
MPEMGCPYLFQYLLDAGVFLNTGMGRVPLTWQELESFQKQQGIELSPFELDVIRMASSAFVHQSEAATNPNCPPPLRMVEHDPIKLANQIKSILR